MSKLNRLEYIEFKKKQIFDSIEHLYPHYDRDEYYYKICSICGEEFRYYPEFKYGWCPNGHEEGDKVSFDVGMTIKTEVFNDLKKKIEEALK